MSMSGAGDLNGPELELHARGPARLRGPFGLLQLRRKALAVLYYLAFEGPTRRERLADLLWDSPDPLANLRVELNAINRAMKDVSVEFCEHHQDPLALPKAVRLNLEGNARDEALLDGLDGLGEGFQEWLDWRRTRLRSAGSQPFRMDPELDARISALRPPHLLVVEPQPCQTAQAFAEAVAQRLRQQLLPMTAAGNGIHYVAPPYPPRLVDTVRQDVSSIWVFERPFFGPDPDELLELRSLLPSADITYLRLPHESWFAAINGRLSGLDFSAASRIYLAACGHSGYMTELLSHASAPALPLLHKFSASIELEGRRLAAACRQLLLSLSVRSRAITAGRAEFMDAVDCLTELTERRWLEFKDAGWRFTSPFARRILYHSLPEGVRQASHRQQAESLSRLSLDVAAQMHRLMAGEEVDFEALSAQLEPWAAAVLNQQVAGVPLSLEAAEPVRVHSSRQERFLEVGDSFGKGVERSGTSVAIVRFGQCAEHSGIALTLPEVPVLVQISGQAFVDNHLSIGMLGDAVPLKLTLESGAVTVLVPGMRPVVLGEELILPLPLSFEYWLACRGSQTLTVSSGCESGIVQFDSRCFEWTSSGTEREAWVRQ